MSFSYYRKASTHGFAEGIKHTVVCPHNGDITGIKVRFGLYLGWRLFEIAFICTSSMGVTTFGPYGAAREFSVFASHYCRNGQYINSFFASISRNATLDAIGIRCRNQNDLKSVGCANPYNNSRFVVNEHSVRFDDQDYSIGARPVSVSVYVNRYSYMASHVSAIQITYENITITNQQCIDCSRK